MSWFIVRRVGEPDTVATAFTNLDRAIGAALETIALRCYL